MSTPERLTQMLADRGFLRKRYSGSYSDEVEAAIAGELQAIFREEHRKMNPHLYDGKHERYSCDPWTTCDKCR